MPHLPHHEGWIEVVVGPMFSGKSEELIRRVKRALIAGQKVMVFKPGIDDRYHATDVTSHDGKRTQAVAVRDSAEVRDILAGESPEVVAFDEAQFFDAGVVPLALELAEKGVRVICAGLDMDFRGEPFGIVPELLSRAEYVEKLYAVCPVCGAPATRTQRLVNGLPARHDDPVILVGAKDSYEPRCRKCHKVVRDEVTTLF